MSRQLADRTSTLTDSLPLKIAAQAKQMVAKGIDVINLSVGEPDFSSPEAVKRAGIDSIIKNFTRYTPAAGIPELRLAIADFLKKDQDLDYIPEQIVVTNGGKQALSSTLLAIVNPGDEVIIPEPCYASYFEQVRLAGGNPLSLKTTLEDEFRINHDKLRSMITEKTKAIIINTPNNPTGAAYSVEEVKALGKILHEHDLWIISDEIYHKLRYDGGKHISFANINSLYDKTIIVNGVSKFFAMTGWRIGFIAAPLNLSKVVAKIQSQLSGCPVGPSQRAALTAYSEEMPEPGKMVDAFAQRANLVGALIREIPDLKFMRPQGAFYILPNVESYFGKEADGHSIEDSFSLCKYLLEKQFLALVPGSAFGAEGFIRISFAASEKELEEGMKRLKEGLQALK